MIETSTAVQQTAWPEGVIARYLTIVGATVDRVTVGGVERAECRGCHHRAAYSSELAEPFKSHTVLADEWAQAHAERCRALPRPPKS